MFFVKIILFFLLHTIVIAQNLEATSHGTVIMYHRFDENKFKDTSISSQLFRSHLEFLKNEKYNVLPISELIEFKINEKILPENSVFITIDDGYKSFFNIAFPILKEYKFPYTVFISTDNVAKNNNSNFMTWEMLKQIKKNGGTIHNHTSNHANLNNITIKEAENIILKAQSSIEKNLGFVSNVFSFPYGSSSLKSEELVKKLGFQISFGQQSSHVVKEENTYRLPRFAFNEEYGEIDRFKLIMKSYPLSAFDVLPRDSFLNANVPIFGFSTEEPIDYINCYHSNGLQLDVEKIIPNRIEVRFVEEPKKGRNRINCTYTDRNGKLFWYGRILIHK